MADYNVNMKQWNGTSFDNVLPLAYNAKQLEGQSLAEVKQWVQDNGLLLYTGQYTGTGTYGERNPSSVTLPFVPILFIVPQISYSESPNPLSTSLSLIFPGALGTEYSEVYYGNEMRAYLTMKKSTDEKTISWFHNSSVTGQMNDSGSIFHFAAIGGYDMGGPTEWVITKTKT